MTRAYSINAVRLAALTIVAAVLAGCSGGAPTTENPGGSGPNAGPTFSGTPRNDDVQAFVREFWTPLSTKTCSSCHGAGGQSPQFMRGDDINLAYDAAVGYVNRDNPALSRFVTKVGVDGHNCWESSIVACGDQLSRWVSAWVGGSGGGASQIQLVAPAPQQPTATRALPDDSSLFEQQVYPLLTQYCSSCHRSNSATAQQPYFASDDVEEAYAAARSRINLDLPEQSRFVVRLRLESHNCWNVDGVGGPDCDRPGAANDSADIMQARIEAMRDAIAVEPFDSTLLSSMALGIEDGTIAAGGSRFDANAIATYQFKPDPNVEGGGSIAYDTSGVEPALHLTMVGEQGEGWDWVGGWGIRLMNGKAQGSTAASRKLSSMIRLTGEYSIEAWVVPGNVTQEEARIVSYSGSLTTRNFTLGQTLYSYDFYGRSSTTNSNGDPVLTTNDDDEDLQATLQHVVATYDPINGRRIYVNGEFTGDADPVDGGNLNEWDETFAFVLGNEVSNNRQFQGTIRFVAIHNRALTQAQITQNFEAGVGEKFFLLFNVSDRLNIPNSFILFEVSQYDSYGYLFDNPRFVLLNAGATPGTSIPIEGMRIGVNGQLPLVGQAYRTLSTTVTNESYAAEAASGLGQQLSNVGTVIALERGPEDDQFFLTFERLGSLTDVRVEADPTPVGWPAPVDRPPTVGLRTFERINATMSKLTGVSLQSSQAIRDTYEQVKQAMPTTDSIETFVSAHPVAITQLAIQYCGALIDNPTARAAYFPGFDFDQNPGYLANNGTKDLLLDPLLTRMVGNLANQPTYANLKNGVTAPEPHPGLYALIERLRGTGSGAARTQQIAKATCATVLGSAATLVN